MGISVHLLKSTHAWGLTQGERKKSPSTRNLMEVEKTNEKTNTVKRNEFMTPLPSPPP